MPKQLNKKPKSNGKNRQQKRKIKTVVKFVPTKGTRYTVKGRGAYGWDSSKGTINNLARNAGQALGDWTGIPGAGSIFSSLGGSISNWFGFGSYKVRRNSLYHVPGSNSAGGTAGAATLQTNVAAPQFATVGQGMEICHREFVGDVSSSLTFSSTSFFINPGNPLLFPWLSQIAQNFEEFEIIGMIVEFKSTSAFAVGSTNTGLGSVVIATDYDVLDLPYGSKRQMEVAEYATSCAPSQCMLHPIECAVDQNVLSKMYIQDVTDSTVLGVDARFCGLGNLQVATTGMQTVNTIGELWVSYHVRFMKPQLVLQDNPETQATHIWAGLAGTTGTATAYNPPTIQASGYPIVASAVLTGTIGASTHIMTLTLDPNFVGTFSLNLNFATTNTSASWGSAGNSGVITLSSGLFFNQSMHTNTTNSKTTYYAVGGGVLSGVLVYTQQVQIVCITAGGSNQVVIPMYVATASSNTVTSACDIYLTDFNLALTKKSKRKHVFMDRINKLEKMLEERLGTASSLSLSSSSSSSSSFPSSFLPSGPQLRLQKVELCEPDIGPGESSGTSKSSHDSDSEDSEPVVVRPRRVRI